MDKNLVNKIQRYHEAEFKLWIFATSRNVYDFGTPENRQAAKAAEKAAKVHGMIDFFVSELARKIYSVA